MHKYLDLSRNVGRQREETWLPNRCCDVMQILVKHSGATKEQTNRMYVSWLMGLIPPDYDD